MDNQKLSNRLSALAEKAFPTNNDPEAFWVDVILHREQLAEAVKANLPTIISALQEKDM